MTTTRTADSSVRARGLTKHYGTVVALDGLDLDVAAGTVLGLLGPNGAGKTTAVSILTTLVRPDAGTATVAGVDVVDDPRTVRSLIGLSGQYAAVDEHLTAIENLEMIAGLYGMSRRDARVRARLLVERFRLDDAAHRPIKTFSGGMRRRVDLAGALIADPPVLFLDEPTTGLDPRSRGELWEVIRERVRQGTTVVLTTQYLEEADQLAGRIAIIDGGTIVREGDPAALKEAVGDPTLRLEVADPARQEAARGILAGFGGERPARTGRIAIGLRGGTGSLAAVIRALDEAGITVGHVEVDSPSLDDVFADATGRRLEGAGS